MDHKDLDVWKKSMDLVELIYDFTRSFPQDEIYGLTSQMKRAVVSIPSNIAEGASRKGDKELIQFLMIAISSITELETQYLISIRLRFADKNKNLEDSMVEVKKILLGFRNNIIKDHIEILPKTCPDRKPIVHNIMDKYQLKKNRKVW